MNTVTDLEIGENGSNVFLKAHVYHPVGFVHGKVPTDVQGHHLLVQHVHEAPGRGNHDVDSTVQW